MNEVPCSWRADCRVKSVKSVAGEAGRAKAWTDPPVPHALPVPL
jgi:hypothetical protein